MKIFIMISLVFAVCIACAVEGWKKGIRGFALEDGTVKTKASSAEIGALAFVLCGIFSAGVLSSLEVLHFFTWLSYAVALFGLQYIIDVGFVKVIAKSFIESCYEKLRKN